MAATALSQPLASDRDASQTGNFPGIIHYEDYQMSPRAMGRAQQTLLESA